ncbi:alpha/beta fold hydrolase [Lysobacter sp. F60174L2]|uniref:alpha/beta fold hydrolase n=1 Tax=Lysobacter sp. F60174L2 TaxID=3459295 RepID=UPI00403D83EE
MGTPQKGESGAEFSELASELGIRLICPTRPWYDDNQCVPSFDHCSAQVISYLDSNGLEALDVMGGSGGGPFALHLASNHPGKVRACYLLASMGTPETFVSTVSSPQTLQLLSLFGDNDYDTAMQQLESWGLPADLSHGAWADFQVLLGRWDGADYGSTPEVFIHHGEDDENAPVESIQALAALLPKVEIRLSPDASHVALATDEEFTEMRKIFREVAAR